MLPRFISPLHHTEGQKAPARYVGRYKMFRFQLCLTDNTPEKQINCVWLLQGFKSNLLSFFSMIRWISQNCRPQHHFRSPVTFWGRILFQEKVQGAKTKGLILYPNRLFHRWDSLWNAIPWEVSRGHLSSLFCSKFTFGLVRKLALNIL